MSLKWLREVLRLILAKYLSDAPRNAEGGHVNAPLDAEGAHGILLDTLGAYEPQVAEGGP